MGIRFDWRQVLVFVLLYCLGTSGLSGCALPRVSAEARLFAPLKLELVDDYTLPPTSFQDVPVGGLSGLAYDAAKGVFYAVSDDRSGFAPARFYTLKPKLGKDKTTGQTEIKTIDIKTVTALKNPKGETYPRNTIDTEGIVLSPRGTVFISSEGVAKDGIAPFVNEFDLQTGAFVGALPIPEHYLPKKGPDGEREGIQDNLGFEGLTMGVDGTPDLFRLFVATENSLAQDLPPQDSEEPTRVRLMHYAVMQGRADLTGEYLYEFDKPPLGTVEQGLSEILSVDNAGHFLALERTFGLTGFNGKIFQFTMAGASDTSAIAALQPKPPQAPTPVHKTLVLDLADLGIAIDNVEGLALGPVLADGSKSLLIVSDDNFNKDQVTQFLLFRLVNEDEPPIPPLKPTPAAVKPTVKPTVKPGP
ncbi:MAG: esterase-like activity of phytase family protein [Alkalinema sp. RU_4_3]|nr:esterase-like activity of phytase family protein [Alkalinema sp. RU_4_3]